MDLKKAKGRRQNRSSREERRSLSGIRIGNCCTGFTFKYLEICVYELIKL